MLRISSLFFLFSIHLFALELLGVGGYDVHRCNSGYSFTPGKNSSACVNITKVLKDYSKNVNSVVMWITKDWQENWYDVQTTQKEILDKGYTPVYIFYWFGDAISPAYVQKHEKEYFKALEKFGTYLRKLKGKKIVILNPEYNMNATEKWEGMNQIFLKSFELLRKNNNILIGPCVGDFGDYDYINEPREWRLFDPSLKKAMKSADFIAFQEMRGLTRNSVRAIQNTPKRAYNFSKYLHKKYGKPTMLAYLAVSSYGIGGETLQANVYKQFVKLLPKMRKEADLDFFGTFHYFDYPGHVGYFKQAEEFFGVLRKEGTKKPSFIYFNQLK